MREVKNVTPGNIVREPRETWVLKVKKKRKWMVLEGNNQYY